MAPETVGGRTPNARITRAFDDKSRGLDRFGVVMTLTVVSVVGLSFFDISNQNKGAQRNLVSLLAAILVGVTLATALRASGLSRRRQRVIDALISLSVLGYAVTIVAETYLREFRGSAAGVSGIIVTLSVAAPVVVVLRLLRHRAVTLATMLGAISAYLLIGLAYFWLFFSIGNDNHFFTQTPQPSSSFMYFSLTTLTTVGYGDLTAQGNLGRLLANSEAVIGQVYLVTFVAMIVGLRVAEWRREPAQHDGDDPDEDPSAAT
jgi:hypothetical protein